jgi:endo-1,4-beta-xylanase
MGPRGERIRRWSLATVALAVVVLAACTPLRDYPAAKTLFLGSAARADLVTADPQYAAMLAREFNGLVPENELKWVTTQPTPTTFNFGPADALVNFARAHGMAVRGVPLLWDEQTPAWLNQGIFTKADVRALIAGHITQLVGHFKGRIAQWDVVNEPFDAAGRVRRTVFRKAGVRFMDDAFTTAHAADPAAKLFLNERGIEVPGPKANAVFNAVSAMRNRGTPITGVGFQMHATLTSPTVAQLQAQMARYRAIGVEVAITEMDVRIPVPATAASLEAQARIYGDTLAACRAAPNCKTFVVWGFTDKYSWVPSVFPGTGYATLMDVNLANKPAYLALNKNLAGG